LKFQDALFRFNESSEKYLGATICHRVNKERLVSIGIITHF